MKKILIRVLCIIFCVLLCPICFSSCKSKDMITLGPYSITEAQYKYLASTFNRQILDSMGLFGYSYDAVDESTGLSIGQALDKNYTDIFQANILSLLYSQLLFDIYELEISQETLDLVDKNIATIVRYYAGGSSQDFDVYASAYGYSTSTIREVYIMQLKQEAVMNHLYGENGDKIDVETLDKIYKEDYMMFQTIVINNVYRIVEKEVDGKVTSSLVPLTDEEKQKRNDIIADLTNLFISPVEGYEYKIIDPSLSYEELYQLYSDDTAYPQGCYSKFPTVLTSQNAITAAALLKENDIGKIVAKRLFTQSGTIEIGSEKININAGDYFEYGYVFVKRMPLGEKPYLSDTYKSFFEDLAPDAKNKLFMEFLQNYEANESNYELETGELLEETPLSSVKANNLDYNFFYGDLGKAEESTTK